jgi:PAS domain S-box-containing protein
LVATDAAGRIHWVNANFSAMCGYSLDELRGRKPGEVLQGCDTDPATVGRIRESLRAGRSCRETIINYHKDGGAYRAEVSISPIMDEENGRAVYFVARERKLAAV